MHTAQSWQAQRPRTPRPATGSHLPERYCPLPERLLHDLYDTPLAIGIYALIGRLTLIHQSAIPLSRADIARFDPTARPGAIARALSRLQATGWLLLDTSASKHRYIPTWGRVRGCTIAWAVGQPRLARPRHVRRQALDVALLDICMGRFTPHPTLAATITRYLSAPALSLHDLGCYALTQAGMPHPTPRLVWLGAVVGTTACPLPSDDALLALCSQRALVPAALEPLPSLDLNEAGMRRLGCPTVDDQPQDSQPLFFVGDARIGKQIGKWIGKWIGSDDESEAAFAAPEGAESATASAPQTAPWKQTEKNQTEPPPARGGGCAIGRVQKPMVPDTEATRLLQSINVRPAACMRHATTSCDRIRAAIADAKARPYVNDAAAWVVSLLDDAVTHGHTITPPATPGTTDWAAVAASLYGSDGIPAPATPIAPAPAALPTPPTDSHGPDHMTPAVATPAPAALAAPLPDPCVTDHATPSALMPAPAPVEAFDSSPDDLTQLIRDELRLRYPDRALRALIDHVEAAEQATSIVLTCRTAAEARTIHQQLAPALRRILCDAGHDKTMQVRIRETRPAAPPVVTSAPPAWIPESVWASLRPLFRAALQGATLQKGQVQGASVQLDALLHTRFAEELAVLLAATTA